MITLSTSYQCAKCIIQYINIIDKTFGYLLRGEIWLDTVGNLASKNQWYKSSSQRDPLSLSRVRGGPGEGGGSGLSEG